MTHQFNVHKSDGNCVCMHKPGSWVGAGAAVGAGTRSRARLRMGRLGGTRAGARWGPPSAAGVTSGWTVSTSTGRDHTERGEVEGYRHRYISMQIRCLIPQYTNSDIWMPSSVFVQSEHAAFIYFFIFFQLRIKTWAESVCKQIEHERKGSKLSSPVTFFLSLFPPGSHLGPEKLIQAILLPAFARVWTNQIEVTNKTMTNSKLPEPNKIINAGCNYATYENWWFHIDLTGSWYGITFLHYSHLKGAANYSTPTVYALSWCVYLFLGRSWDGGL